MKSKVYYGEYSLKHWIKMLLSKNIILPEYQRSFVWDEKDVRRLVDSIQHGQFVQPVTIALYKVDEGMPGQNLIIDGQQRLSSILLAYLGYVPDKNKFEKPEMLASDEDDAADETLDDTNRRGPIKWRFSELFDDSGDNTEGAIRKRLENAYKEVIKTAVGGAAGVIHQVDSATTDCQPNENVEALRVFMLGKKIEARPTWKPTHKQPVYAGAPVYTNGIEEELFKVGFCLPAGPYVTNEDVRYIVESIKEAIVG